jgi:phosphatidylserine/phosphatidylglycerophosphate/cardiolipin synthase-like enzyme
VRRAIMGGYQLIAEEAGRLARSLSSSVAEGVAVRLEGGDGPDWETLWGRVVQAVPSPHHRSLVVAFLDRWRSEAREVPPQAVAAALHTAVLAERERRGGQSVELVWTGPDVGVVPLRRTEQVVLQVIDSARERLLVVSYAVFHVPRICEALIRAADRGVAIHVVVESPDRIAGQHAYSTLKALGDGVAACSTVYFWPREKRKQTEDGRVGILHVKCAVADGHLMFLSSANLTEYAFSLNMELGVLVTGGTLAGMVEAHFDRLIEARVLTPL